MYTALFFAPVLLLLGLLGLRVSSLRRRHQTMFGDAGQDALSRAIRAHGNAAEHTALLVPALLLYELLGAPRGAMIAFGSAFVLGRLLHSAGMSFAQKTAHTAGSGITFTLELVLPVVLFLKALSKI